MHLENASFQKISNMFFTFEYTFNSYLFICTFFCTFEPSNKYSDHHK